MELNEKDCIIITERFETAPEQQTYMHSIGAIKAFDSEFYEAIQLAISYKYDPENPSSSDVQVGRFVVCADSIVFPPCDDEDKPEEEAVNFNLYEAWADLESTKPPANVVGSVTVWLD